ncbi:hypothetical protein [Streptomyces albidoflavus]|uniref:hypothetical protein n=1 Tax=Streptomyces albidoflavus TaxID=1886 RepID=UPI003863E39A|nr:hypothetical protein OG950_16860 [Streptomyces albidoflavus]
MNALLAPQSDPAPARALAPARTPSRRFARPPRPRELALLPRRMSRYGRDGGATPAEP